VDLRARVELYVSGGWPFRRAEGCLGKQLLGSFDTVTCLRLYPLTDDKSSNVIMLSIHVDLDTVEDSQQWWEDCWTSVQTPHDLLFS
jgi:hypothetical protein